MSNRSLWSTLIGVVVGTFLILGWFGREVYRQAPPIPQQVVASDGRLLFTEDDILSGQQVYQSMGGQQVGTVWGHGAYVAPDWSADWLHREAVSLLDGWARATHDRPWAELEAEPRAALQARLIEHLRRNTYDPATGTITVSTDRAAAMADVAAHYNAVFGDPAAGPEILALREDYAIHDTAIPDPERRRQLTAFFWWTAWACAAERPGTSFSYTNNWPHEPLIGNRPTTANLIWSIISIVLLLGGIGALETGLWSARSAEFMQQPAMQTLRWLRVVGDVVFAGAALSLAWFVVGLWTGWSYTVHPGRSGDE